MKNKWVAKGEGGTLVRGAKGEGVVEDTVRAVLQKVEGGEALGDQQAKDLKRRKLVTQVCVCMYGFLTFPLQSSWGLSCDYGMTRASMGVQYLFLANYVLAGGALELD